MSLTTPISDDQLRQAHRDLDHPVSFEMMQRCPALMICLRNLAEIRSRGPRVNHAAMPVERRAMSRPAPAGFDRKRAAANDRDEP